MKQDPPTGTRVDKGATVKLTVAKERPEVPDVTTDNPTEEEATATLEQAGFKVQMRTRAATRRNVGRVDRPVARRRARAAPRGATVTIYLGSDADAPTPTPTPTPTP